MIRFAVCLVAALAGPAAAQLAAPPRRPDAPPPAAAQAPTQNGAPQEDKAQDEPQSTPLGPGAQMRGLDKFSALSRSFFAPLGGEVRFERLRIRLGACRTGPDGPVAWLEVLDDKAEGAPAFSGWMFAQSPAVSALDNPRYDVWLISCETRAGDGS